MSSWVAILRKLHYSVNWNLILNFAASICSVKWSWLSIFFFQELVGALLACSFFCLFPTNDRGAKHLPMINFDHMFAYVLLSVYLFISFFLENDKIILFKAVVLISHNGSFTCLSYTCSMFRVKVFNIILFLFSCRITASTNRGRFQ